MEPPGHLGENAPPLVATGGICLASDSRRCAPSSRPSPFVAPILLGIAAYAYDPFANGNASGVV